MLNTFIIYYVFTINSDCIKKINKSSKIIL